MRLNLRGFSIVELLAVTAITGLVAGLITATLARQQRFYSSAESMLTVRSQMRDAAEVLVTDIRGSAAAVLGFPLMTDTAVEMYATVGTSVACSSPVGAVVGLPPATLVTGHTLTSIVSQPDTGDLALMLSVGRAAPDSVRWLSGRIASFAQRSLSATCPPSSGFTTSGDSYTGATGYQLTLTTPPDASVRRGSLFHFVRRVRYSLYRSSDGRWYLGYRRCNLSGPPSCATVQPVSGPYMAPSGNKTLQGLRFRYYDSRGIELTGPGNSFLVARVDITIRGETAGGIALAGDTRRVWRDSAVVTVSPRNRSR